MSSSTFAPRVGSTNLVELAQLRDHRRGTFPTDATVTVTVLDNTGTPVVGASALPMPYDAATQVYRGVLPSTLPLAAGTVYTRVVTVIGSQGDVGVLTKAGVAVAG